MGSAYGKLTASVVAGRVRPPKYYVSGAGDDTSGDGSVGAPWKTISKAIATVPDARCRILVADGTYQESTSGLNYLYVTRQFTKRVDIESLTGIAANVIIQGTAATYHLRINGAKNIRFKSVTFAPAADISQAVVFFQDSNISNISFFSCVIETRSVAAATRYGVYAQATGVNSIQGILFSNCIFQQTGAANVMGARIQRTVNTATVDAIAFLNCNFAALTNYCIYMDGVTNINIDGCTMEHVGAAGVGLQIGNAGLVNSGRVYGVTVSSTNNHAMQLLNDCTAVTVSYCTITGGDHAFVFKETGGTLEYCTLIGGSLAAFYFKAAVGAVARYNTIQGAQADLVILAKGDTGNKCQGNTFTHNTLTATGTADLYNWGDATHDDGGSVVDQNQYDISGTTGNVGGVYGTAGITNLAGLQAAWATYDLTTNDANSTMRI
jgi:hypothetical protein